MTDAEGELLNLKSELSSLILLAPPRMCDIKKNRFEFINQIIAEKLNFFIKLKVPPWFHI